jgi:hypothetical protein
MGVNKRCYWFLKDISLDRPSYFELEEGKVWPYLLNPKDDEERGIAAFYLLLHSGYLTRSKNCEDLFRIPNKEIMSEYKRMMKSHLKSLCEEVNISDLLAATIAGNIPAFGREITKSLYTLYRKRKKGSKHFVEEEVQDLIYYYLLELEDIKDDGYIVVSQDGEDGKLKKRKRDVERKSNLDESESKVDDQTYEREPGIRMDLHLKPKSGGKKAHYVIELKRHLKDDESIYEKALEGLKQIYEKNYIRRMIMEAETTAVITMGLATHFDKVCLATLKIDVLDGMISGADTIHFQKFEITGKSKNKVEVKIADEEKAKIKASIDETKPIEFESDKKHDVQLNNEYMAIIVKKIEKMIKERKAKRNEKISKKGKNLKKMS